MDVCGFGIKPLQNQKGKEPDYTAGPKVTLNAGRYFFVDLVHFRGSPKLNEDTILQTAKLDGGEVEVCMEQEHRQRTAVDTIDHYAREVLVGYNFHGIRSTGDKTLYAAPWRLRLKLGTCMF